MEDKHIKKYNELEKDFFSTSPNWTYSWYIESIPHCLDWDFDNSRYNYYVHSVFKSSFKDIYDALDGIIINKKTLRQLILETEFDFDMIN